MRSTCSLRLLLFSIDKCLSRRTRDFQRRYCSARATRTGTVTVTEERPRLRSGPGLAHFIQHTSSNQKKIPEVYDHEEPYLPENFAEARKGERTVCLYIMGHVLNHTLAYKVGMKSSAQP